MLRILGLLCLCLLPAAAQEYKIAIVGLVHSHVWGHLTQMAQGKTPAKLVAIAEPNPELVAEARKSVGSAVRMFADYRQMLEETKPDIVWAFVENNRHLEIVEACAPRKIQIIFEKPLASTYKDALAIQRLANQHGIRVMTNYQMAWWPSNYAMKARVDAGAVGKVWRLRGIVGHGGPAGPGWEVARNKFFKTWLTDPVQNGGGALVDFGCYNALWALWLVGRPETVYAELTHLRPQDFPKVEDSSTLVLAYKDGVGIFEGSWDLPRGFQDLEVFGRTGSLYLTSGSVESRSGGAKPEQVELTPLPPERAEPVSYMTDRMKKGEPLDGMVALPVNVGVVEIIEAAKRSVASGRAVKLPLAK